MIAVEFMIYNSNNEMGVVSTYRLLHTDTGFYRTTRYNSVFLPNAYNIENPTTYITTSLVYSFIICILILTVWLLYNLIKKLRQIIYYKINETSASDISILLQVIVAYYSIYIYFSLFFSSEYFESDGGFGTFTLPLENEDEFQAWVTWTE